MSQQTELQGFLSIKIPPKMRGFLPWKVWRRQWISIRCLPTGGIDLVVGRNSQNSLRISPGDIIVRTRSRSHLYAFGVFPRGSATANFCLAGISETDSQKWIATIRKLLRPPLLPVEENEFFVSVVDNTFTRSSGFSGLYGILRVANSGITIVDPFTSKIKACWSWRQLSHLYIATSLRPEDRGRICTIITSREFPSGVGQIRLFCLEAVNLIQELTRGKSRSFVKFHTPKRSIPYRHFSFSPETRGGGGREGNSAPCTWLQMSRRRASLAETVKHARRLSKSEGNLLSLLDQFDNSSECSDSGFIHDFYNSVFSACFSDNEERSSTESDGSPVARKVAPSRNPPVQADVIIATDHVSSHVYQKVGSETEDEEESTPDTVQRRRRSPRRRSGVSVASGVYEEIDELSFFASSLTTVEENASSDPPPPLPPRRDSFCKSLKRNIYENVSLLPLPSFSSKYMSKSAGNTPLSSPPSLSRTPSSADFIPGSWQKEEEEESHYLPMSPCSRFPGIRGKSEKFSKDDAGGEEQIYVVMSNFKKDQT